MLALVHVPPLTVLLSVKDEPGHMDAAPLIVPALVALLTVMVVVEVAAPQLLETE